jgi:homocitrate synthase
MTNTKKAPSTYEIIDPADFGMNRNVHFASRLTGWNAIKTRVQQLGLTMTDDQVKEVYALHVLYTSDFMTNLMLRTQKIKAKADTGPLGADDADAVIRAYHLELQAA